MLTRMRPHVGGREKGDCEAEQVLELSAHWNCNGKRLIAMELLLLSLLRVALLVTLLLAPPNADQDASGESPDTQRLHTQIIRFCT